MELDQNKVSKTPVSKQAAKTYSNAEIKPGKSGEKQPTVKKKRIIKKKEKTSTYKIRFLRSSSC